MTSASLADVQNRVTEIQQRLGLSTASTKSASAGSSFSDVLSAAVGQSTDTSTTSDLLSMLQGTTGAGNTADGSDVVADAQQYLGVPYVWGGTDPSKGLDCSGLVQRVYKDLGIDMPRVAADQARQGTAVASLAQAKPGDLVAFDSPVDHIGIYAGNNKMIVAPKRGDVVKIEDVYKTPSAIRRIIPDTGSTSLSQTSLTSLSSMISGASTTSSLTASSLTANTSSTISGALSSQYNSLFTTAGAKYGISPTLLAAVAKQESGFNASAGSSAGAQGLMQLMPSTANSLGVDPLNPSQAVDGAAKMFSGLVKQFGSTSLALAAYNAGPGAVQKYNGIPPYKETQNYVKNILAMTSSGAAI